MDELQIVFIICTNNEQYYSECVRYIEELEIPEGYNVDIIKIQGAESMTQGYNAGMRESKAKYKVYLHHDTYILNKHFIKDCIRIFKQDMKIGMLGVIGAKKLPENAMCYSEWDVGRVDAYNGIKLVVLNMNPSTERLYTEVEAVDGMLLVTQYDLTWREDLLDGWDFYDVSQSLEMQKYGYRIVVPFQRETWCYHDCGVSKLSQYDNYRKKMVQEYPEVFTGRADIEAVPEKEEYVFLEDMRKNMIHLISLGMLEQLNRGTEKIRMLALRDTQVRELVNMMEIYSLEKSMSEKSGWWGLCNWDKLYSQYTWVRHVLMRIELQREDERIEELSRLIKSGWISRHAIWKIANITLEKICNVYQWLLMEGFLI